MSTSIGAVNAVMDWLKLPMMLFSRAIVLPSTPLRYVVKLTTGWDVGGGGGLGSASDGGVGGGGAVGGGADGG